MRFGSPDGQLAPIFEPGVEVLKPPVVNPHIPALIAVPMAHEQRPSGRVEVVLGQLQRF